MSGGRIPVEYKELYLYVKTGKVPDAWSRVFAECGLLSEAKVEDAKYSVH